jgi:hypothetical protein
MLFALTKLVVSGHFFSQVECCVIVSTLLVDLQKQGSVNVDVNA